MGHVGALFVKAELPAVLLAGERVLVAPRRFVEWRLEHPDDTPWLQVDRFIEDASDGNAHELGCSLSTKLACPVLALSGTSVVSSTTTTHFRGGKQVGGASYERTWRVDGPEAGWETSYVDRWLASADPELVDSLRGTDAQVPERKTLVSGASVPSPDVEVVAGAIAASGVLPSLPPYVLPPRRGLLDGVLGWVDPVRRLRGALGQALEAADLVAATSAAQDLVAAAAGRGAPFYEVVQHEEWLAMLQVLSGDPDAGRATLAAAAARRAEGEAAATRKRLGELRVPSGPPSTEQLRAHQVALRMAEDIGDDDAIRHHTHAIARVALALDPPQPYAANGWMVWCLRNDPPAAERFLEELRGPLAAIGGSTAQFEGRVHLAMGRPDAAAEVARSLPSDGRDAAYNQRLRADLLVQAEVWPEALEAARAYLGGQQERQGADSPHAAGGHLLVGRALLGTGDRDGARSCLETALAAMGPDHPERFKAEELAALLDPPTE